MNTRPSNVRLVWYDDDQNTNITTPFLEKNQTKRYLAFYLDRLLDHRMAISGQIEEWVSGKCGWIVERKYD